MCLSAALAAGGGAAPDSVSTPSGQLRDIIIRELNAPPVTTTKPKVSKSVKNPVNIPVSTRRMRPGFTEGSNTPPQMVICDYFNGFLGIEFRNIGGDARVVVRKSDSAMAKVFHCSAADGIRIPLPDRNGDGILGEWIVEIHAADGAEYLIEFEVTE